MKRPAVLLTAAVCASSTPAMTENARAVPKFRPAWASWYGPGLWNNQLGCGGKLQPGTIGVAHKTMDCGKRLRICVKRCHDARVIDRGPYVPGREFDLTMELAQRLGFNGVGRIFVRSDA